MAYQTRALTTLSLIDTALGNYESGIELSESALALAESLEDSYFEKGIALQTLGIAWYKANDPVRAISFLEDSLDSLQVSGVQIEIARTNLYLGQVYQNEENLDISETYLNRALNIQDSISDKFGQAMTLAALGRLNVLQGNEIPASAFYKKSVEIRQEIREELNENSAELADCFIATFVSDYASLSDLLVSQGNILEAERIAALGNLPITVSSTDMTFGNSANSYVVLNNEELIFSSRSGSSEEKAKQGVTLTPEEQRIINEHGTLLNLGRSIAECERNDCHQVNQLYDRQEELEIAYREFISSLETQLSERRRDNFEYLDLTEITSNAYDILSAQPGSILVYPLVLEDKLVLIISDGYVPIVKEIDISRQELARLALEFRYSIVSGHLNNRVVQEIGGMLYDLLIAPIESELASVSIKNLIFVQDEVLRNVPISALYDLKSEVYLIEKYAVSTITSTSLTNFSDRYRRTTLQNVSVLSVGLTESVGNLPALPGVAEELEAISRYFSNSSTLLNQEFTYESLRDKLRDNITDYGILHIATHAVFGDPPEDSFIIFGGGERLRISEFEKLSIDLTNVDLVVLSASQTALGSDSNASAESLSQYFLNFGVNTVIASLWQIDDIATSVLMSSFYEGLQQGLTKSEALRRAQLTLLAEANPEFSRPAYWASFILLGDPF